MTVSGKNMRQLLLGEILARNSRKFPRKTALVWPGGSVSYGKMNERVNALSQGLMRLGVKKGDKVALLLTNSPEILEGCFAAFKIGTLAVPLNFRLAGKEIEYILIQSEASVLILDGEFAETIQALRSNVPGIRGYIVVGPSSFSGMKNYEGVIRENRPDEPVVDLSDDDDALILYTAGTTGRPKGAVLTHKNFMINALNWVMEYHTKFEDKWLCVPPLYHSAALGYSITHFYVGATIYLAKVFDPGGILKTIQQEKITTLFLVPAMWIRLLQEKNLEACDRSSLRVLNTGAAITPIEVKSQLLQAFPNAGIYDCFGQTEMSPAVTLLRAEDALRKQGSVGQALACVEIRVVNDEDQDVPIGEVGEAIYRGPNVMKGYYKNPEATEEAMRGGWFHSGDLVRQDEEGYFYVVDRKKDMIISGGENIYPAEVEEVLYRHPDILEAAVFGIPDEQWGESVKATVVLKSGKKLTAEEVIDHCKQYLASYKKPKSVDFLDALPRNPAGKVLKTVLREKYWAKRDRKI